MSASVIAVVLLALFSPASPQDQNAFLRSLVPESTRVHGWSEVDTARTYEGRDLFLFIDGGADLFFEYGFRRALAAEYRDAGGKSITLEIYEMIDPGAAFGIYSIRSGEEATSLEIGEGGSIYAYYIMFWKGRFHVSVAASDSTAECRDGLEAIARAVDHNISEKGGTPDLVHFLPRTNLLNQQYFRGLLGLSSTRILDVNGIFPVIDGAVGTYGDHTMILLRYGSAMDAKRRQADIKMNFESDSRFKHYQHDAQIMSVVDGMNRTICVGQSGSHIIVSISPKKNIAETSCKKAISQLFKRKRM